MQEKNKYEVRWTVDLRGTIACASFTGRGYGPDDVVPRHITSDPDCKLVCVRVVEEVEDDFWAFGSD